jgi:hypothetical protein
MNSGRMTIRELELLLRALRANTKTAQIALTARGAKLTLEKCHFEIELEADVIQSLPSVFYALPDSIFRLVGQIRSSNSAGDALARGLTKGRSIRCRDRVSVTDFGVHAASSGRPDKDTGARSAVGGRQRPTAISIDARAAY